MHRDRTARGWLRNGNRPGNPATAPRCSARTRAGTRCQGWLAVVVVNVFNSKHPMTLRRVTTFRLDDELFDGLQEVWARDGVPPSEQVRRAIRLWLESKGVSAKKTTKRSARPARRP